MIWCIKTYVIAYAKTHKKKRFIIHYVKPTAQLLFKIRFPKGGPTCRRQVVNSRTPNVTRTISCKAWNSPAEYLIWVARCDMKGSVSTVLNPIFSKKVQGQKLPGRWGIVEHQIPSIKFFKTNTKSHKHPSIRFLSKSRTQLVNQRKQKVAFSPGTAHSPIERDGVQLRQYWMTLPLYIRPITELL